MNKISALIPALLCSLSAFSQKDIPAYGKIDKEDLTMTACDFDPEAAACILIKTGETTFNFNGEATIQTEYRYRVKILKDNGVDHADVKIHFYSKDRVDRIDGISGETYNLDAAGNIVKTKLERSSIYNKDINSKYSEVVFTMPDVKKGSVFEYKFTKISKDFYDIDDWYFQDDIPTRYANLYLSIPQYFDFTYQLHRVLPIDIDKSGPEGVTVFTMKNIPGLRDEPYMSAERDYLQRMEFQLSSIRIPGQPEQSYRSTWTKLNEELLEADYFGAQLHRNIPHTDALDAQLASLKDSTARMSAVYEYVRQHMDWNGSDTWYSDGVRSAWDKKTGSTGDINLILVNLLRDAGLDAHPIMVSTRDHGRVNTIYPMLDQFNEVMAYVELGNRGYVLNGADKYNPYRLIPYDVQYTQGFVVDKNMPGWVNLVDDRDKYKNVVIINGSIDPNGILTGSATINNYDYSKNLRCKHLKEGLSKFKDIYFLKAYTSLKIDSIDIQNQDDDSEPLIQSVNFSAKLNSSGQYLFYTPNMFLGLEQNPFVEEHRFTDVDFGYRQSFMIVGTLSIPDGYQLETLPKNVRMIMQDTSIDLQRMMQVDDDRVSYRITLEFKRPLYFTDEYPDFREFYKKLYATLNEQIVLRKKST